MHSILPDCAVKSSKFFQGDRTISEEETFFLLLAGRRACPGGVSGGYKPRRALSTSPNFCQFGYAREELMTVEKNQ
jgi:hypothetical protein